MNPERTPESGGRWRVLSSKMQILGGVLMGTLGLPAFFYGSYELADDYQSRQLAIRAGNVPEESDTTIALISLTGGIMSCMFSLDIIERGKEELRSVRIDNERQNNETMSLITGAPNIAEDFINEQQAS